MKIGRSDMVECECSDCRCENITYKDPKYDPEVAAVCLPCDLGKHAPRRKNAERSAD